MLKQRRLLTTMTFSIGDEGVDVVERSPTLSRSFRVPFSNIPAQPTRVSTASGPWLWTGLFLLTLSVATGIAEWNDADVDRGTWLIWGILGIAAALKFAASKRRFVVFQAGDPGLVLFDSKPSPTTFDAFLDELHRRRVDWWGQQVAPPGAKVPDDLDDRLQRLRAVGFLSAADCQRLSAEVTAGRGSNPIGFGQATPS